MRTLPRNNGKTARAGDYPATCDICGAVWLRSRLREDPYDGFLRCPKETGADGQELSRLNQELTSKYSLKMDNANGYDPGDPDPSVSTFLEDLHEETFGQPFQDYLEDL